MHVLEVDFKELEEDFKELKTNLNSNRRAFTYEARNSTKHQRHAHQKPPLASCHYQLDIMQMQPRYTKVPVKDDEDASLLPSSSSSLKQRAMQNTQKAHRNQPEDLRFEEMESPIPYKSIILSVFLAVFGISCFVLAWLHWTQQLLGKEQAEFGFMFLGLMTFIPGAYHCRIAFGAWRGERGYVWELIPEI